MGLRRFVYELSRIPTFAPLRRQLWELEKKNNSLPGKSWLLSLLLDRNEDSETVSVFMDGCKNYNRARSGFGIFGGLWSPLNCSIAMESEYDNNAAEFYAVVYALERILKLKMDTKPIVIYTDCLNILHFFQRERFETVKPLTQDDMIKELAVSVSRIVDIINMNKSALLDAVEAHVRFLEIHARIREIEKQLSRKTEVHHLLTTLRVVRKLLPKEDRIGTDDWICAINVLKETALWQEPVPGKPKESNFYNNSVRSIHHLASQCRKGVYLVRSPGHIGIAQNELADVLAKMSVHKDKDQTLSSLFHQCYVKNRIHEQSARHRRAKILESLTLDVVHIPHNRRVPRYVTCDRPVLETIWKSEMGEIDYQMWEMLIGMKKLDVGRVCDFFDQPERFYWNRYPSHI